MTQTGSDTPTECLNCGTTLQGQWCHYCGQKSRAGVRHFGSVVTDILDTVFEYDNRIWRTLLPLYFNPGKISTDFIAGRRVRYVLPFRLFFVMSVVMFLTLQFTATPERLAGLNLRLENTYFDEMNSESEVIAERDRLVTEMELSLQELAAEAGAGGELGRSGLRTAIRLVNEASEVRLAELRSEGSQSDPGPQDVPDSGAADAPPPQQTSPTPAAPEILLNGRQAWHPVTNPLVISWLPPQINTSINAGLERAMANLRGVSEDPGRLIEAMLNLLPLVLFFMMPVFALLLKIFYMFSHRAYMEHFIVGLHSHSFLFLAILISLLLNGLSGLAALPAGLSLLLSAVYWLSVSWIPVYLFLMQRRVYAQGWLLTSVKYSVIGILYVVMLFFALLAAAAISLINL